jgi:hypothetical protein
MTEIDIFELECFKESANSKLAKQYKSYLTIRRNYREIEAIIRDAIGFKHSLPHLSEDTLAAVAPKISASVSFAIIVYSRWFKSTNGKTSLRASNFFDPDSPLLSTHTKIIAYRDECIAHQENDLFESDKILAYLDKDGYFKGLNTPWERSFIFDYTEDFLECIHKVHNKIDSYILPKLEVQVREKLKSHSPYSLRP